MIVSLGKGQYLLFSFAFFICIIIIFLFRPSPKMFLKRTFLVFLYPLAASIFIPFVSDGNAVLSFNPGMLSLTVTDNGIATFLTVIIKSFLSVLLMASLIVSTDERELLHGLRKMHLPKILVSMIFLMYRYIFLIRDEFKTGQLAINSRVFEKSYKTINKKLAFLIGNVFIRSIDRAESVYRSMESRGFDGNFYIIEKDSRIEAANIISLCIFILMPLSVKLIELVNII